MKSPNFLIFMTDQQSGQTQRSDNPAIMPNLKKLASQGVTFDQAYCPSPHCCPSRASFFSGLYPSEHGVWNNVDVPNTLSRGLFDSIRLFPEDLKDAGYDMFFSGKWHVSAEEGPDRRGFELLHHMGHQNEGYKQRDHVPDTREWKSYIQDYPRSSPAGQRTEGEIIRPSFPKYVQYGETENPFRDQDVVSAAVDKIKLIGAEKPFFMYVGTLGPHDPYFCPRRFLDLYDPAQIQLPDSFTDDLKDKPNLYKRTQDRFAQLSPEEHRESIRHYLALCSYEDFLFGQLLDALSSRGILDDTVVIYVSDHGDYMGAHGLWTKGLPCFREAYHICSTIGYGKIQQRGRVVDDFISLVDYAPTILELAGVPTIPAKTGIPSIPARGNIQTIPAKENNPSIPAKENIPTISARGNTTVTPGSDGIKTGHGFAGRSLVDFLMNDRPKEWRSELFTQTNGNETYGIQRSIFDKNHKLVFNGFDYDELYDLEADPNEMINEINNPEKRDIIRCMYRKLWKFAYDNKDNVTDSYITTALAQYGPGIIFEEELQESHPEKESFA
jgi:arylsulfatase A-like enzyme